MVFGMWWAPFEHPRYLSSLGLGRPSRVNPSPRYRTIEPHCVLREIVILIVRGETAQPALYRGTWATRRGRLQTANEKCGRRLNARARRNQH